MSQIDVFYGKVREKKHQILTDRVPAINDPRRFENELISLFT